MTRRNKFLDYLIEDMEFSKATHKALKKAHIKTLKKLSKKTPLEILKMPGIVPRA